MDCVVELMADNRWRLRVYINGASEYVASYSKFEFGSLDQAKKVALYHQSLINDFPYRSIDRDKVRELLGFGPIHSRDYSNVKLPPQGSEPIPENPAIDPTTESNDDITEPLKDLLREYSSRSVLDALVALVIGREEKKTRCLAEGYLAKEAENTALKEEMAEKDKKISELEKIICDFRAAYELAVNVGSKIETGFKSH